MKGICFERGIIKAVVVLMVTRKTITVISICVNAVLCDNWRLIWDVKSGFKFLISIINFLVVKIDDI